MIGKTISKNKNVGIQKVAIAQSVVEYNGTDNRSIKLISVIII